jgi:hypothetical protein
MEKRYLKFSVATITAWLERLKRRPTDRIEALNKIVNSSPLKNPEGIPESNIDNWPVELRTFVVPENLVSIYGPTLDLPAFQREAQEFFSNEDTASMHNPRMDQDNLTSLGAAWLEQRGEIDEKVGTAHVAYQRQLWARQVCAKLDELIGDVGTLAEQGYKYVFIKPFDVHTLAKLETHSPTTFDELIFFKPEAQASYRHAVFRDSAYEMNKPALFYRLLLRQVQDEPFLQELRRSTTQSSCINRAWEWMDRHGTEIILWEETEKSKKCEGRTLAWVKPSVNGMNIVRHDDGEYEAIVPHEFRHLIERILVPEFSETYITNPSNERESVDHFITVRLVEAAAHAYHNLAVRELQDSSFRADWYDLFEGFLKELASPQLLTQYDCETINLDVMRAIHEGRLPELVTSSRLVNVDVIGRLLRFHEDEENILMELISGLDTKIGKDFIGSVIIKLSTVLPPHELEVAFADLEGISPPPSREIASLQRFVAAMLGQS